jgi:protein phosphatase
MHFNFYSISIPSLKHPGRNEDAIAYDAKGGWIAVLDGVGGTKAGKEASNKALEVIKLGLSNWHEDDDPQVEEKLKSVVEAASLAVSKEVPEGLTTAVISKIVDSDGDNVFHIASVGDSRTYLFRRETLTQITQDDNMIPKKIEVKYENVTAASQLNELERKGFLLRSIITQAVGQLEPLVVRCYSVVVTSGDRLIFCTDGIHDNLTFNEIEEVVAKKGDIAKLLVEKARKRSKENHFRSKPDDMSAIVIQVN